MSSSLDDLRVGGAQAFAPLQIKVRTSNSKLWMQFLPIGFNVLLTCRIQGATSVRNQTISSLLLQAMEQKHPTAHARTLATCLMRKARSLTRMVHMRCAMQLMTASACIPGSQSRLLVRCPTFTACDQAAVTRHQTAVAFNTNSKIVLALAGFVYPDNTGWRS